MSSISRILDSSDPRRVGLLFHMGNKRFRLKKWSEAAEFYRQAYNIKREEGNEDDELDQEALKIKFKIGAVFGELNKYESAEKTLKGVLSRQKELLGEDHTETQLTQHYYGRVLSRQSKWKEAHDVYEPLWQLRKELLNDESTADLALRTAHELGRILNELDRFGEAAEVLGVVYPAAKRIHGEMDKVTLSSGVELGKALRCSERQQDAKIILDEIIELCQQSPIESNHALANCTHELAMLSCHGKNFEEAEKLAREAWMARTTAKGSTDIATLDSAECLSKALHGLGRMEEAQELLEDVYHHLVARFGQEHTRSLVAGKDLGGLLLDRLNESEGESPPAEPLLAEMDTLDIEESQTAHSSRRRRKRLTESASTASLEWYLTKRYIGDIAKRHPMFGFLFPPIMPYILPRSERSQNSRHGQNSQLLMFEEAARENPFLQRLAKAVLVVSSVFKGFEARLQTDILCQTHSSLRNSWDHSYYD
jgi:tetratricopeptide (TPR) repeat protein